MYCASVHPRHGKSEQATRGQFQSNSLKICNFCKGRGHWKADCPKANSRRGNGGQANSGVCVVSVEPVSAVSLSQQCTPRREPDFSAFVSDGHVSLVGGDTCVPVKILRDTAAFDLYILSSVLPFSENSNTGDFVLMRGMGVKVEPVPMHSLILDCG